MAFTSLGLCDHRATDAISVSEPESCEGHWMSYARNILPCESAKTCSAPVAIH